eukprot:g373.t1
MSPSGQIFLLDDGLQDEFLGGLGYERGLPDISWQLGEDGARQLEQQIFDRQMDVMEQMEERREGDYMAEVLLGGSDLDRDAPVCTPGKKEKQKLDDDDDEETKKGKGDEDGSRGPCGSCDSCDSCDARSSSPTAEEKAGSGGVGGVGGLGNDDDDGDDDDDDDDDDDALRCAICFGDIDDTSGGGGGGGGGEARYFCREGPHAFHVRCVFRQFQATAVRGAAMMGAAGGLLGRPPPSHGSGGLSVDDVHLKCPLCKRKYDYFAKAIDENLWMNGCAVKESICAVSKVLSDAVEADTERTVAKLQGQIELLKAEKDDLLLRRRQQEEQQPVATVAAAAAAAAAAAVAGGSGGGGGGGGGGAASLDASEESSSKLDANGEEEQEEREEREEQEEQEDEDKKGEEAVGKGDGDEEKEIGAHARLYDAREAAISVRGARIFFPATAAAAAAAATFVGF